MRRLQKNKDRKKENMLKHGKKRENNTITCAKYLSIEP
jgi:hypothetical protein